MCACVRSQRYDVCTLRGRGRKSIFMWDPAALVPRGSDESGHWVHCDSATRERPLTSNADRDYRPVTPDTETPMRKRLAVAAMIAGLVSLQFTGASAASTSGSLDPTFAGDGVAFLPQTASDAAVQPDGKSVVVGGATDRNGRSVFAVSRFNRDGTVDLSFSGNGMVRPRVASSAGAGALEIHPNGRIIVGGRAETRNNRAAFAFSDTSRMGRSTRRSRATASSRRSEWGQWTSRRSPISRWTRTARSSLRRTWTMTIATVRAHPAHAPRCDRYDVLQRRRRRDPNRSAERIRQVGRSSA